jgi:hypothetical protein
MTANSKIALHHVGGRWGNHPFPQLPAFAGDLVEVLYEADTDAIAAIREAGKDRPNELIVIPACLADSDGDGLLHIYLNPGLTSLRELNHVLDQRYQNTFGVSAMMAPGCWKSASLRPAASTALSRRSQRTALLPISCRSMCNPANMRCCSERAMRSTVTSAV